mmetsp:Transcript_11014/g.22546  ORF Transcript_11014/g.22546 Transcript_11014/m.22546 type:complete len:202 (-) Transcript_11014:497-1102(-)
MLDWKNKATYLCGLALNILIASWMLCPDTFSCSPTDSNDVEPPNLSSDSFHCLGSRLRYSSGPSAAITAGPVLRDLPLARPGPPPLPPTGVRPAGALPGGVFLPGGFPTGALLLVAGGLPAPLPPDGPLPAGLRPAGGAPRPGRDCCGLLLSLLSLLRAAGVRDGSADSSLPSFLRPNNVLPGSFFFSGKGCSSVAASGAR